MESSQRCVTVAAAKMLVASMRGAWVEFGQGNGMWGEFWRKAMCPGAKGDAFLENVLCAFRLACLRSLLKKSSSGFLLYVYLTDKNIFVTDVCFATYIFINKEQLCLLGSDK